MHLPLFLNIDKLKCLTRFKQTIHERLKSSRFTTGYEGERLGVLVACKYALSKISSRITNFTGKLSHVGIQSSCAFILLEGIKVKAE